MSGQVSRGSAREYQADERAGVAAQLGSIRLLLLDLQFYVLVKILLLGIATF